MRLSSCAALALPAVLSLAGCGSDMVAVRYPLDWSPEPPTAPCEGVALSTEVNVVPGPAPVFAWSPACAAAIVLVEHRGSDQWGIATDEATWDDPARGNLIAPPVTYGSVPAGAHQISPSPPEVLQPGVVYDLGLWRAVAADASDPCPRLSGDMCLMALYEFYADRLPPSQSEIAFWSDHDGQLNVYAVSEDGSKLRKLTGDSTLDVLPVWSPGRLRIAFASGTAGLFTLQVMSESGLEVFSLGAGGLGGHDWSPDGSRIVFASGGDLFAVGSAGGGLTRLTDTPEEESDPAWSPDGLKIAFAEVVVIPPQADIFVVDQDGYRARLTDDEWFNVDPAWSPDGSKIAYTSWRNPEWQIRVMDADGSNSVQIADGRSPSWSPDGTRVVFADPDGGLVTVSIDGSVLARMTDFGHDPDWSN